MVTLDKALLCLQHRMEAGQNLEDACFKVSVACKADYYALQAAYMQAEPATLPKTKLAAGYGWPDRFKFTH